MISRGRYAELLTDQRGFTADEQTLFDDAAEFAYRSFRDKAAASRGMAPEEIEEHAQGRVWSGLRAIDNRCAVARIDGVRASRDSSRGKARLEC